MSRTGFDENLIMNTPIHFCTRRGFMVSIVVGMATAGAAPAQLERLEGDIRVQGSRATFSVETARPLDSVAWTMIQQYNWPVTFEESLSVYPGDWIDATRDSSSGGRAHSLHSEPFEFSYDLGPGGEAPEDPAAVLRTAVEKHHQLGLPGRYALVETADYLHIVPTARRDEAGEWQAERSPLDSVVTLDGRGRSPDAVLQELRALIGESAGYEIHRGFHPVFKGDPQPRVPDRFEHVTAREVLRTLIATSRQGRLWSLKNGLIRDESGTKHRSSVLNLRPYRR